MARERRPARTSPAGPGRSTRTRAGSRASGARTGETPASGTAPSADESGAKAPLRLPRLPNRLGLTRRALAVLSVLVVLALSYANSLRIYLDQQRDLAEAAQQIQERTARIAQLEDELERWNDPAYIKAQARERLGWLLPGETGYRVIGPDGKPLGTGVVLNSENELPPGEHPAMWFDRLWGSVETADKPTRRVGR